MDRSFVILPEFLEFYLNETFLTNTEIGIGIDFDSKGKPFAKDVFHGTANTCVRSGWTDAFISVHTHPSKKEFTSEDTRCNPPSGNDLFIASDNHRNKFSTQWEMVLANDGYYLYRAPKLAQISIDILDSIKEINDDIDLYDSVLIKLREWFEVWVNGELTIDLCHKKGFRNEYLDKVRSLGIEIYYYKRNTPIIYPPKSMDKLGLLGGKK